VLGKPTHLRGARKMGWYLFARFGFASLIIDSEFGMSSIIMRAKMLMNRGGKK
jgi:hypothetical protein